MNSLKIYYRWRAFNPFQWIFCFGWKKTAFLITVVTIIGCEKFYEPDIGTGIKTDEFFADESEYRAAAMGLYSLQQQLVEQLVVLGELRADLMKITENADLDLREIYYYNVSPGNKYASARNFYRLIDACNRFMAKIEENHPEVLDKNAPVNNFDRYYGEALCMRAWAYFNAARIYGEIPYIPPSITGIEEIEEYVNSPKTVKDTFKINFSPDGYYNDTIRIDTSYVIDNAFIGLDNIIDTLTTQLKTKVKAVGVNHWIDNSDVTWDATIWTNYSMQVLLGQMYLTRGDYVQARNHFAPILYNYDTGFGQVRFGLDNTFRNNNWRNILTGINLNEHIYVVRFNKADKQQHRLQYLFSSLPPNTYQVKPTRQAVLNWETIWDNFRLVPNPEVPDMMMLDTVPARAGTPGDYYRGINVSYGYFRGIEQLRDSTVRNMLEFKRVESTFDVSRLMDGVDTVITKYSLEKDEFAWDADFILYRAAAIHLYAAEITVNQYRPEGSVVRPNVLLAERFLNDGSYNNMPQQLGVRGRVGFANGYEYVTASVDRFFPQDPFTNQVIGVVNLTSLADKQIYLEEKILEEKARELAFEGERFYDLMRIAKRRNDNSFLANRVAAKFVESEAAMIRERLMNEENWYIPFYIGTE